MNQNSMANGNNYPEELKKQGAAALALTCIKNRRLDKKAKANLHKYLKTTYLGKSISVQVNNNAAEISTSSSSPSSTAEAANLNLVEDNGAHGDGYVDGDDDYKPPDIPPVRNLNGVIGNCSKPLEKKLTNTDLKVNQCRLSMNRGKVLELLVPLLNEEEYRVLKEGIPVTVYDLDGNTFPMSFKVWSESKYYVLTSGWTKFHQNKGLADKHVVTLWMFRHAETQKLCFVISWREVIAKKIK